MKVFEHPNMYNFLCPVCKTSVDLPVVLVPMPGTEKDGLVECRQIHKECFELVDKMYGKERE